MATFVTMPLMSVTAAALSNAADEAVRRDGGADKALAPLHPDLFCGACRFSTSSFVLRMATHRPRNPIQERTT